MFFLIMLLAAHQMEGIATWYGTSPFLGNRTPSGIICDGKTPQAAHKTLPFGVVVRVLNAENGNIAYVLITDRGPYVKGRILDLNPKWLMDYLCGKKCGMAKVRLQVVNDKYACKKYRCLSKHFGKYLDKHEIEMLGLTKKPKE